MAKYRRKTVLKRKIYNTLLQWKQNKGNECLMIKGARQVGKTYLVREFGKTYESFIEINFYENSEYKNIFQGDLSSDEIIKKITAFIPNTKIIPNKTLIFLDEIQRCARARTALKFLAQDDRIDVITSGSLLGLSYGTDADSDTEQIESIPVGYEKQIQMFSMDFEEYLWARGYGEDAINYLKSFYDKHQKVPYEINKKYEELLREYIVVGGMPEVVATFVKTNDLNAVDEIQKKIINSYEDDIVNHAKSVEKVKVRKCFDSIPRQLARENRKFKYSDLEKGATSRKYGESIEWLINANLVYPCYSVSNPEIPLRYNDNENEFKLYLHDTGLLMAMYGFATKQGILTNSLTGVAKGGIYENLVADALYKKGYDLHYFKRKDDMELEFVIESVNGVIPIEVKAGNTATKSLNKYIEDYNPPKSFKVINGNIGEDGNRITIPHYMIMFI